MNHHPNYQLAKEYYSVAAQLAVDPSAHRRARDAICASPVDIARFYHDHHHDLSELNIRGIGSHTKSILELILEKGVTRAQKKVRSQKEAQGWRKISRLIPVVDDDSGPSWGNTVWALERY